MFSYFLLKYLRQFKCNLHENDSIHLNFLKKKRSLTNNIIASDIRAVIDAEIQPAISEGSCLHADFKDIAALLMLGFKMDRASCEWVG